MKRPDHTGAGRRRNIGAILLMLVGIAFLLLGFARGEAETVLRKAVNLCLECIGIG
ncbi:MAG: thioredoxin [Clostridiales bacterium]|nr:thioredoxin [Clostridiales bacterium]